MASSNVVVVSADLEAQQALAILLDRCGLVPIPASTVREAEAMLNHDSISVILCSKELPDGGFSDILRQTARTLNRVPVIVFSRLADWERYLNVLRAGAFDYVLYPPIREEIERVDAGKPTQRDRGDRRPGAEESQGNRGLDHGMERSTAAGGGVAKPVAAPRRSPAGWPPAWPEDLPYRTIARPVAIYSILLGTLFGLL